MGPEGLSSHADAEHRRLLGVRERAARSPSPPAGASESGSVGGAAITCEGYAMGHPTRGLRERGFSEMLIVRSAPDQKPEGRPFKFNRPSVATVAAPQETDQVGCDETAGPGGGAD
jgi:hypothetical protein